jgi:hypothetical protein
MSLFGDLPSAKNDTSGSTLLHKRTLVPPPSILRSKRSKAGTDTPGGTASAIKSDAPAASHGLFAAFGPREDEYDPAVPNEYQQAKEEQERAVLEAEMEARRAAEAREAVQAPSLWHLWRNLPALVHQPARRMLLQLPVDRQRSGMQPQVNEADDAGAAPTGGLGSASAPGASGPGANDQHVSWPSA